MHIPYGLTGLETIRIGDQDATILEFWRWAFSDIRMNDLRGVFAEQLVGRLLGIDSPPRDSWIGWDLETASGVKIEVKAAAYVQSWPQSKPSAIKFDRLRGKLWQPDTGYAEAQTHNADIYIFCVQIEKDLEKWDGLDLDQWRFYILTKEQVERTGCKSLGLAAVKRMASELDANNFRRLALHHISAVADSRETNV